MNWLKRHWFDILLAIAIIVVTFFGFRSGGPAVENVPDVYVIRLDGDVEYALYDFISDGIKEAEQRKAEAVLIEIATFGGRVDAMTDIGEVIATSKVPVYTFVRGKALSAGAYIALSGKKIVMTPEAVMGASEPRDASNQPVTDEKVMSAMRGLFRAAANARKERGADLDPTIAEAMVDSSIEVRTEGVRRPGELVVLTGTEALALNYCDYLASTRDEALAVLGFEEETIVRFITPSPAQRLARVLSNSYVSMILLIIGIIGIIIEFTSPGFGVPGVIGILAFALFFGARIMSNLAGWEVAGLFILGLVLMILEAMVPGFGILGISGIGAFAASIILAYPSRAAGLWSLGLAFLWMLFAGRITFRLLGNAGAWDHLILRHSELPEEGYVAITPQAELLGREGVALTVLRPSGSIQIDDTRIDAISEGTYIPAGTPVRVVKVEGNRIVVRSIKK
jgi:membrane-bound serine protease (ClpP class)